MIHANRGVISLEGVFVTVAELPASVRSFVVANADQTYTIVINSRLNYEQNIEAYYHEINHICNGDYDKKCSVDLIEINAHRGE